MIDKLLADLNDPQREAVTHTDGPLLILAGPGSGKTRVVTRRAAYLSQTVTSPHRILAITFTNKAAAEMRERVDALEMGRGMTVGTFHAWCARMLREYHDRFGVARNFTIFDRDDRRKLIKAAVESCDLLAQNWSAAKVEGVISRAKNDMVSAEEFAERETDWATRTIARIYSSYERLLHEMDAMDFDDLLMLVARRLGEDTELAGELENRYSHVLIDEYQDTNAAQYLIAKLITSKRMNLCATGDPDQSIYGWRGADLSNILNFERDYPSAKVVRLEQNYRSTGKILSAAAALVSGNVRRKEKKLWTSNPAGASVKVIEHESGEQEADAVARAVASDIRDGVEANEIGVFYRINSLSRAIEEAFLKEGIAYQIARGVEFYNRKEIKDALAYLRVLVNPADELAALRIINTPPRGIGATTVERLRGRSASQGRRMTELLGDSETLASLGRSSKRVQEFGQLLQQLGTCITMSPARALSEVISRSGLRAHYAPDSGADDAAGENLDELINAGAVFEEANPDATVVDWLEHAALVSDVDMVSGGGGAVTLMTLHAAKGLEFESVYVIGVEEGLLPLGRAMEEDGDAEEERRLAFVGITRAKQRLTLSHARYRMLRGITERAIRSSFLDELPRDEVEWISSVRAPLRRTTAVVGGQLPADIDQWAIGTLVRHPVHGLGQVVSLERGARRTHVDVQFESGSRRAWVLEFAHLERVDFDDVG